MVKYAAWVLLVVGVFAGLSACGGGGGGGSTGGTVGGLPVAPDPTCSSLAKAVKPQTLALMQARFGSRVIVPRSTVPQAFGGKPRAHTNHLILASSTLQPGIPTGYSPTQIRTAYGVPANGGAGAIAVVDAFDDPNILGDFNVFSTQFGLPKETSSNATSASNTVFQVVYATGSKPTTDASWAQESSLDAEWSHAIAPKAKIFLVEAASDSLDDLMSAVNIAKRLPGVKEVSTSFGVVESGCEFATYDSTFIQSGVVFFAASGDDAPNQDFPGESKNVICVGGTTLNLNLNGTYGSESAWDGTSCGISSFEPRPIDQNPVFDVVGKYRGAVDISADGDPATGVSVYDSLPFQGASGWQTFGGTSAGSPMIAGMANVAQTNRASSQAQGTMFYAALGSSKLHDVTTGSSGGLDAGPGYDLPTGVGSPNGLGAF